MVLLPPPPSIDSIDWLMVSLRNRIVVLPTSRGKLSIAAQQVGGFVELVLLVADQRQVIINVGQVRLFKRGR